MKQSLKAAVLLLSIFVFANPLYAQGALTFDDVMKFEDIKTPGISYKGNWLFYGVWPDRGDGRAVIRSVQGNTEFKLELGSNPVVSTNERWAAAFKKVPLNIQLKEKKDAPKQGMTLLNLQNGAQSDYSDVQRFVFTNDGNWLAVNHYQTQEIEDLKSKNKKLGTPLTLINLNNSQVHEFPFVASFVFDSLSTYLAYSVIDTAGRDNGLYAFELKTGISKPIDAEKDGYYSGLRWDEGRGKLAYTSAAFDTAFYESDAELKLWDGKKVQTLVKPNAVGQDWVLRSDNTLTFSYNGKYLFFGLKDIKMVDIDNRDKKDDNTEQEIDIYDINEIVGERGLDIWHTDDPLVKPMEKITWNRRKNHQFVSVYNLDKKTWRQLADKEMPNVRIQRSSDILLGSSDIPYQKEITWDGSYSDWFTVDLTTGKREKFITHLAGQVQLSPKGNYAAYYSNKDWYLYDVKRKTAQNLTSTLSVPFYNEDNDVPAEPMGYGVAGWLENDAAVLIYDKFDIWRFDTNKKNGVNLTNGEGRSSSRMFRVRKTDKKDAFSANQELLLTSYNDLKKNNGFFSLQANKPGIKKLLEEDKRFTFLGKAENSDAILYKREAYDEYPNLWVADSQSFGSVKKVTHLHDDLKQRWNWGKAELIDWQSADGVFTQGVVIKPDNYDAGKKYPVFIYYYELFSDKLHEFNVPVNSHRPVLAQYVSDGYVVFLPDIRYETGRPGISSVKYLVPGVQKLIETGIADKDKIGLHGHSWSGYETAYIVTQTNMFAAAIAGAPVGNMTSAYGGIRWESGMARQFQYEKTQSRIGASIAEAPLKYIENSPVFYADRVQTPLLIMHGDDDGAVPWYQSIELYLALRRYNKNIIFLQYHGEPHHLTKYPNKLDYAIRMKEYFDYYLRGIGEPEWILSGEPFIGK